MNKLTWTKTKPTVPGSYWTKGENGVKPLAQEWSQEELDQYKDDWDWWAGPIPEDQLPQEPDQFDTWWKSFRGSSLWQNSARITRSEARAIWDSIAKLIKEGE